MQDLFTAIKTHWDQDPLAASALTALYNTEADDDADYPYCVFSQIDDTPDFTFTEDFEDVLIQFVLYSDEKSSVQVNALFGLIKGVPADGEGFDFLDINISNYDAVSLVREGATLIREKQIWEYAVTYSFTVQKDSGETHLNQRKFLYNLMGIGH